MKKDYDITLRGHHLILLFNLYVSKDENGIRENMLILKYSKRHTEHTINILKKITESDIRIKIVDALDDICRKCRRKRKCANNVFMSDVSISADANLRINEIYDSKHILETLEMVNDD